MAGGGELRLNGGTSQGPGTGKLLLAPVGNDRCASRRAVRDLPQSSRRIFDSTSTPPTAPPLKGPSSRVLVAATQIEGCPAADTHHGRQKRLVARKRRRSGGISAWEATCSSGTQISIQARHMYFTAEARLTTFHKLGLDRPLGRISNETFGPLVAYNLRAPSSYARVPRFYMHKRLLVSIAALMSMAPYPVMARDGDQVGADQGRASATRASNRTATGQTAPNPSVLRPIETGTIQPRTPKD
jgi:hypothetical protein